MDKQEQIEIVFNASKPAQILTKQALTNIFDKYKKIYTIKTIYDVSEKTDYYYLYFQFDYNTLFETRKKGIVLETTTYYIDCSFIHLLHSDLTIIIDLKREQFETYRTIEK